jgi:hypothetical protein
MYYTDGNVGIGTDAPNGLLHVAGAIRMGSEAGTAEDPRGDLGNDYQGVVIRRTVSTNSTDGNIIARTDIMRLERDGTNGGLILRWGETAQAVLHGNGYTIDSSGNMAGVRVQAINQTDGGSMQVTDDADDIVHLHLAFGNFHNSEHTCEVTISRSIDSDNWWTGFLKCTYDQ